MNSPWMLFPIEADSLVGSILQASTHLFFLSPSFSLFYRYGWLHFQSKLIDRWTTHPWRGWGWNRRDKGPRSWQMLWLSTPTLTLDEVRPIFLCLRMDSLLDHLAFLRHPCLSYLASFLSTSFLLPCINVSNKNLYLFNMRESFNSIRFFFFKKSLWPVELWLIFWIKCEFTLLNFHAVFIQNTWFIMIIHPSFYNLPSSLQLVTLLFHPAIILMYHRS